MPKPRARKPAEDQVKEDVGLIYSVAIPVVQKYPHLEIGDLISEGWIGLHRARQNYRQDMGTKFCTYAAKVIKSYIDKYVASERFMGVHVNQHTQRQIFRIYNVHGRRWPSYEEVHALFNWSRPNTRRYNELHFAYKIYMSSFYQSSHINFDNYDSEGAF